jgi:hypothetical protein
VAFLFSDDGGYVTGQIILADGGRQSHLSEPVREPAFGPSGIPGRTPYRRSHDRQSGVL